MRLFPVRAALAAASLVFFSSAAGAETAPSPSPAPSPTPSASSRLPVIGTVETGDRRPESLAQTSRVTFVVDRAHIDAWGARTVSDALADVPGLTLTRYGGYGAQVNYGIRGSNSAQTLVLVDGQPVASADSGVAYLDQLSTIGVKRIEVIESGASTLYGTSASGGVINIITSVPRGEYVEASAGSFADRDARLEVGGGNGNGYAGFSLERRVATQAYPYGTFDYGPNACTNCAAAPTLFPAGVRDNAFGDQTAARASAALDLGDGFRLKLRADDSALTVGVPGSLYFPTAGATQLLANSNGLLHIERQSAASTFSLDLSGALQKLAYAQPPTGESDAYTNRSQISLKEAIDAHPLDAVVGVDLSREGGQFWFPAASGIPAFELGAAQAQSAAYAQVGVAPLAGTRLTAGVRAEHDSPAGSVLAPSLGGITHFGAFSLAANVGESFRVPTLNELYYPGFGNPALLPEKATVSDATVGYALGGSSLSLGWFERSGSNFIVFTAPTFIPYNAQRARTQGLALTANAFTVFGAQVALSFTDIFQAEDIGTNTRLPDVPNGAATLSITRPFGTGRIAYGARWLVAGTNGEDVANVPPPITGTYDSYATFDAYVRYRLAPNAIVSLRGFNLGNQQYAPIFGYPALGQRFYVELATR